MNSMYEILMDLPLFQGVSHSKISELIEKIKFHFLKYLNGEQFIASGDVCSQLRFIISGKARIEIFNRNKRIKVCENIIDIANYQRNTNDVSPHISQNGSH